MKQFHKTMYGLISIGTIALFGNAGQAYAQAAPEPVDSAELVVIAELPEGPGGEAMHHAPWPEKLELSDDQMEQLVSMKADYEIETAKTKAELKADMQKMMLLMTEPKTDKQAVLALNDKIQKLKDSLSDARVNHMLKAMDVMTPKQKEQIHHHMLVHILGHHHGMGGKGHMHHHPGHSA